jgi:hypothetical protein
MVWLTYSESSYSKVDLYSWASLSESNEVIDFKYSLQSAYSDFYLTDSSI